MGTKGSLFGKLALDTSLLLLDTGLVAIEGNSDGDDADVFVSRYRSRASNLLHRSREDTETSYYECLHFIVYSVYELQR